MQKAAGVGSMHADVLRCRLYAGSYDIRRDETIYSGLNRFSPTAAIVDHPGWKQTKKTGGWSIRQIVLRVARLDLKN
jgi:hypothetical protein